MAGDPQHTYYELRLADVVRETDDAHSFVLEIPEALDGRFAYRAGQFLTFRIPWNGVELQRCYSLASSPDCGEPHKVTVKRVERGRVSNWFNDGLATGDALRVLPPEGRFVLQDRTEPLALFAGGSGITPTISLLKTALVTGERDIKLVYANRDAQSIIFREELEGLAKLHSNRLELIHHLDVDRGFLEPGAARAHLAACPDADVYICGPGPFMDTVEVALAELGVPRTRIFIERFISPTDPDRAEASAGPPLEAGEVPAEIEVTLEGERHSVPYRAGQTLLEAAREAGLQPSFACEEGYCSTCMARLKRGRVAMRANDALTQQDLDAGYILTCQSVPQTADCEIDWDDY